MSKFLLGNCSIAATALAIRSAPSSSGFLIDNFNPVFTPALKIRGSILRYFLHAATTEYSIEGTTEAIQPPEIASIDIACSSQMFLRNKPMVSEVHAGADGYRNVNRQRLIIKHATKDMRIANI